MKRIPILIGLVVAAAAVLPGGAHASGLTEVKKLTASDAQTEHFFGTAAISGDTIIVRALGDDTGGALAGAAYVFERDAGGSDNWGEVAKLTASDAEAEDLFGISVAISGDTAVVGARFEDAAGADAGAAYVFQRDEGGTDNWGEVKKLTASNADPDDLFGSVAIDGATIVVGASGEDSGGASAGAAYVFERDEGGANNWGEVEMLTASDAQAVDLFGVSVAISADTVAVGASNGDAGAGAADAGAAYVFERNEGGIDNWGEVKKLTASDAETDDLFRVVAIDGDTIIVGAFDEDAGGADAGAAYVFERDEGGTDNWGEVKKLTASDAQAEDSFGGDLAVSGDTAVVGAFAEDAGGVDAGAAYVFERDAGGSDNWGEVQKLTASDAEAGDLFGPVALSGGTVVVGASGEDAGGADAGAAYVFEAAIDMTGDWGFVYSVNAPAEEFSGACTVTLSQTGSAVTSTTDMECASGGTTTASGGDVDWTVSGLDVTGTTSYTFSECTGAAGSGNNEGTLSNDGLRLTGTWETKEICTGLGTTAGGTYAGAPMDETCASSPCSDEELAFPDSGSSVTFETVTETGSTTILTSDLTDGGLPATFGLAGPGWSEAPFYHVLTTTTFSGDVTVCVSYNDADSDGFVDGTSPPVDENNLQLLHNEGGTFDPDTVNTIDTANNEICAVVSSLSEFAFGALADNDLDGCLDVQENGADPNAGGLRDPDNFWDFYDPDTENGAGAGTHLQGAISLGNILTVAGRFGQIGDPGIDPLSDASGPGYHTRYDRGPQIGANVWNTGPANGSISLGDVLTIAAQFTHNCT